MAQQQRWSQVAATRSAWEIRGLRLGMSLAEIEGRLAPETLAIEPARRPDGRPPAYGSYQETIHLGDGSQFQATFSSPVSGGLAAVLLYEQTLRDGPSPQTLLGDLQAKYGPPDERGASGWWLTWHLKSRVPMVDGLGAFLKVHFRTNAAGRVEYFRAVLNDYKFLQQDEQAAAEARREAERRDHEGRRSDQVRF